MTQPNDILLTIGKALALIGKWLMALAGAALAIALPVILIFRNDITAELREEMADPALVFPAWQAGAAIALALASVVMLFFFFDRLVRIIRSVGDGDPFEPANARRLADMGWLMLGVQLVAIPLAGLGLFVAKTFEEQGGTVDVGFDADGLLLVIILFILARVFRHGAAMREDLEGTV